MENRSHKYFVGGIPSDVNYWELNNFFQQFGVLHKVTNLNSTNAGTKTVGYCFVKFLSLNDNCPFLKGESVLFKGRSLDIAPIIRRTKLKRYIQEKHDKRLFINNIPVYITSDDLLDLFSKFGTVAKCYIVPRMHRTSDESSMSSHPSEYHYSGNLKNYGYVTFTSNEPVKYLTEIRFLTIPSGERLNIHSYNPKTIKGEFKSKPKSAESPENSNTIHATRISADENPIKLYFSTPTRREYFRLRSQVLSAHLADLDNCQFRVAAYEVGQASGAGRHY